MRWNIHPRAPSPLSAQEPESIACWLQTSRRISISAAGGAFSVLGKAMLGIAGAYLLRAVAESSSLPRLAVAAVAIVYASCGWYGRRERTAVTGLPGATYACTSALILAPMLWELTLRFKVLPAAAAAGVAVRLCIAASPWHGSAISPRSSGWPMSPRP